MNILHLSDIHFGRNNPTYGIGDNFEKHDEILEELIRTITSMDRALRPEHIFFTGDIVWHGKTSEYQEALNWFNRLLSGLGLTGKDISFCVGNHDLDLACECESPGINDYSIDEIDSCYKYENVTDLDFPLYGYNDFCRDIGMEPYSYFADGEVKYSYSVGYKDITFECGKTIRVLGLNTALLLPFSDISNDKMWLGQQQIKTLMSNGILPAPKDIWYTITLCHHSDRFLHPDETSTYNGRPATLPLLLENVNLVLCGHTESSGKPRLSKQQGGGNILCSGAAYYSDDHINAFSMIYLSETRRTMGFLPYVYDGKWQDYDFLQKAFVLDKEPCSPDDSYGCTPLENVTVVIETGEDKFSIPCRYLKAKSSDQGDIYTSFDNRKDIVNTFRIDYDGSSSSDAPVHITLSSECKLWAKANHDYKQFVNFIEAADNTENKRCKVLSSGGEELFSTPNFTYEDTCRFDISFLEEICALENTYDVRFKLPKTITEADLKKIRLLKKFSEIGYVENAVLSGEIKKAMDRNELQMLYDAALQENKFCIKSSQSLKIHLFDVTIDLGDMVVYATPFYIDIKDIKHKLTTFCQDDIRMCSFIPDIDLSVYMTRTTIQPTRDVLPASSAKIQYIENIDLTVEF